MSASELDLIMRRHGTDKGSNHHGYHTAYELILAPYRHRRVTLLEVGTFYAQGLLTWEDYLPHATIIGVDIDPRVVVNRGRVSTVTSDILEYEPDRVLDIIIDDGSHQHADVLATYQHLCPYRPVGESLYVVEDVSSPIPGLKYDLVAPNLAVVGWH